MKGYQVRNLDVDVGAFKGQIQALSDHMQFADPTGSAEEAGICSASWSMFGQLWPASHVLAKAVKTIEIEGRSVLELGCGLALPSLVLQYRGANITASDHNPITETFLNYNTNLNNLPNIPYLDLPWGDEGLETKRYDLIIGSDILYEPNHADLLVGLIERIAEPKAKVLVSCPGRGHRNNFSRSMRKLGFVLTENRVPFAEGEKPPYKGRLLSYQREG